MLNEVGIFLDDGGDAPLFEELFFVVFQIKRDGRSLGLAVGFSKRELLFAVGFPADGFVCSGFESVDDDFVRDHEGSVEADAELTDEFGICGAFALFFAFREVFEEGFCSGVGDCAEVLNNLLFAHADAVVRDAERSGFGVRSDADFPLLGEFGIGECEEARLVNGVGGIGDEFAQENFFVGVDGVDHHVQKFADFRLKTHIFHICFSLSESGFSSWRGCRVLPRGNRCSRIRRL